MSVLGEFSSDLSEIISPGLRAAFRSSRFPVTRVEVRVSTGPARERSQALCGVPRLSLTQLDPRGGGRKERERHRERERERERQEETEGRSVRQTDGEREMERDDRHGAREKERHGERQTWRRSETWRDAER